MATVSMVDANFAWNLFDMPTEWPQYGRNKAPHTKTHTAAKTAPNKETTKQANNEARH